MSMSTKEGAPRRRSPAPNPWTSRVIVGDRLGIENLPDWFVSSYESFRKNVIDPAFPCFFGTTAERRGDMFYAFVNGDDWTNLGATMARFAELSRMPQHLRSNFALFFEPREVPLDPDAYRAFCWKVLQHLHDADQGELELDVDPTDPAWEFAAFGQQMFVVGCSPSYGNRRSRNLGPGIVMLFQPRAVFIDQVTKRAIGDEARAEVRRRLMAWDGYPHHPEMGVYGDPTNLEWRQYFLADDNVTDLGACPFLQRRRATPPPTDFVSLLRGRARTTPDRIAARFIPDAGGEDRPLTYAELDGHARRVAAELLTHAQPGDRAMILAPSGLEYLISFFACCYAGLIAVPAYPATKGNAQHFQRLVGMIRDARPRVLVVDAQSEAALEAFGGLPEGAHTVVVRSDAPAASAWEPAAAEATSLAFLQYTSGSTGSPKGVMVSHANLVANCTALASAMKLGPDDVVVSWLPLYHDMGLIGTMLLAVFSGIPFVFMSPQRVIQSPVQWLKAVAEHGGTISGGPNFAYQLCVDRIKPAALAGLDLSRWRFAFCGAEPVRAATLEAFADRFASCAFDRAALAPAYGLAEATLLVSSTPAGSGMHVESFASDALAGGAASPAASGISIVDCGTVALGHRVRIADPVSGREFDEGSVGEIWFAGPSVTGGYWQNAAASAEILRTVVHEDGSEERFLRTGDLGFVHRGRVFVNGRVKDTLVIRGQNLYPQDIEQTVFDGVPSVRKSRASVFPFTVDGVEGIGVAAEVSPAVLAARGAEEIIQSIVRAISAEHEASVELVLLLRAGTLPRTSSGKLRRSACVPDWQSGALVPAAVHRRADVKRAVVAPRTDRERALLAIWKDVLGRDDIGIDDDFFALGADSIVSLQVVMRAREAALVIAPRHVFEHSTVERLAAVATDGVQDDAPPASDRADVAEMGFEAADVDDVYPATPVQEGLLFHDAYEEAGGIYVFQVRLTLRGKIDDAALKRAWELAVARHDVLRTSFVWSARGGALQVVHRTVSLPYEMRDASALRVADYDAWLAAFQSDDVGRGFDVGTAPLMRLTRIARPDGACDLAWTIHHALFDGWSAARIVSEVLADHAALASGAEISTMAPPPFRAYVDWLQRRPSAEAWWRSELARWDDPATVGHALGHARVSEPGTHRQRRTMTEGFIETLKRGASRARVTLHTLAQAAWGIVLARYAGRSQAIFGSTLSGRTPELPGVERMVGLFINTLPMRIDTPMEARVDAWLRGVQEHAAALRDHEGVRLSDLQKWAGAPPLAAGDLQRSRAGDALFDSVLVFENYPAEVGTEVGGVVIEGVTTVDRTHYPLTVTLYPRHGLDLEWEWDGTRVERAWVDALAAGYEAVLLQLASSGDARLGELILGEVRAQAVPSYTFDSIGERVRRTAKAHAEKDALSCEGHVTRYGELEAWSNRVGHALAKRGVKRDELVGLCVERSAGLVAGLLGVWKAGGAFVPLDPTYPEERLREMLAGVRVVVCDAATSSRLSWGVEVVSVDAVAGEPSEGTWESPHPEQLAYVIYTSGSTGQPKGVAVSHRSLSLHVDDFVATYGIGADDRVLFTSTINFDVSLHELLPVLTRGGRSVMRGRDAWELSTLTATLRDEGVTFARVSTAYWQQWVHRLPEALPKLRQVTVGGEGLAGDALQRWFAGPLAQVKLDNLYGPTETTVASHRHATKAQDGGDAIVPIGHPFPGRTSYVLDAWGNAVPQGGVGELCIGGASVARGYLARPSLTAERFVPDPHARGGRLYRSGDVCRERADGVLEFLGRADAQIKLRGYRIELGEIESALRACAGVTDAVAEVKGEGETRRLVGYVTGSASVEGLRAAAEQKLPSYMVPSAYVLLDALPLLPNGKVNRRGLPEPEMGDVAYQAPRTASETALQGIWQTVLKRASIGVTENFFELGGDSILSLQIIARAREAGWKLTPKQVFEQPTIESCARVARPMDAKPVLAPAELHVDVPLSPIQARFFQRFPWGPAHWNQSILLRADGELHVDALAQSMAVLVARHDALRLRFTRDGDAWRQCVAAHETNALVEVVPSSSSLAEAGERLQRSLDLEQGPLLRAGCFQLPGGDSRVLLTVHHLAVDGVSWRVLLEELELVYAAMVRGDAPVLPAIGTPWSVWASRLREHALREAVTSELAWWKQSLGSRTQAEVDLPGLGQGDATHGASREIVWTLDATETRRLVETAPRAYRMRVDEVLLTALAQTMTAWTGRAGVLVDLEGHGREDVVDGVDIGRTIGWFTTRHPVWLEAQDDAYRALVDVKERLRAVPHKGLHWGLLGASIDAPRAAISFNYLGRFEPMGGIFALGDEPAGSPIDPSTDMAHALDLNAIVREGTLRMGWRFSPAVIDEAVVRELVASFGARLRALLDHGAVAAPVVTASDFALAGLTQASLEAMSLPLAEIQDVYPATPVQQGLIFESLVQRSSGAYINQLRVTLRGELDTKALRDAWASVVARHDILRTHFEWRHGGDALQVVHRTAELPFAEHDWSREGDYEARLARFLEADLARGFALDEAPLLRVNLFRRPDGAYDLLRTSHHALSDGWSAQLLFGEIFTDYSARRLGRVSELPRPVPYRDYVAWLVSRPSARAFWEAKFRSVDDAAGVLLAASPSTAQREAADPMAQRLSASLSRRLREGAQRHRVTLNTLAQGAWAIVLGRMANRVQALFGVTVSGRPPELDGADRILGPFINTLPQVVDLPADVSTGAWLRELQREATELGPYEHTPLRDLQRWVGRTGDALFDSIVVFENYPTDPELLERAGGLVVENVEVVDRTHYPLTLTVLPNDADIALEWSWDPDKVARSRVAAMAEHFIEVLEQLAGDSRLGDVHLRGARPPSLSPAREGAENDVSGRFVSLGQRIAEQARLRPDAEAVVCEGERVTYAELEARAHRIGRAILDAGVGDTELRGLPRATFNAARVGVCVDRSVSLVAACLGVWKAGGAYVPLDPSYPEDRLRAMIAASRIRCVVADAASAKRLRRALEGITVLDVSALGPVSPEPRVEARRHAGELAYVVFTSGSTGEPKPVGIGHGAFRAHVADYVRASGLVASDVVYQFATLNFDVAAEQIFPALATGARLVMRGPGLPDWVALHGALAAERVSVVDLPTAYWAQAIAQMREPLPALRLVSIGGEAVASESLRRWYESPLAGVRLVNAYGPTEATISCMWHETTPSDAHGARVPIGRPLASRRAYVLDRNGHEAPLYGIGELCVGGEALARGYLERPGATARSFVPDPVVPGARVYRTGDVCRLLDDGIVEFLGRADAQIKLRGHRIELGEIELALHACPGVRDAVAVVRGAGELRRLVGYVTGDVDAEGVTRELAARLPAYMVPSAVVVLPALPLRLNGKVDREALPEPEHRAARARVEPRTDIEQKLVTIWRDVLQQPDIGISDDFFALGGDSISSLRVVARARELGIGLTPKQVLAHPTIAELALAAGHALSFDQSEIREPLPLTPIQAWFFEQHPAGEAHYNQFILLRTNEALSVPALEQAIDALVARHDALRLRFHEERDGAWQQCVAPEDRHARVVVHDLRGDASWKERLDLEGETLQKSLSLHEGPLVRAGYFRIDEREGRLLLVVHHLAVDGVSWRVLLGELATAYAQAARGETIALPARGTPWSVWSKALLDHAAKPEVLAEAAWWQSSLARASVRDGASVAQEGVTLGASIEVTLEFDAAWTRALLDAAGRSYRVRVDEVLLTSLAQALVQRTPGPGVLVDVEGHGREAGVAGDDASHTVGWFTTQYPVWLELPSDPRGALRAVKDQLRAVPHRGLHFGLLRYGAEATVREALRALPRPDVNFNYLGQLDGSIAADEPFAMTFAREASGSPVAASSPLSHALDVNALIEAGTLQVSFRYDPARIADIDTLVAPFEDALRAFVANAPHAETITTAADFPLAGMTPSELDGLGLDLAKIEDIYPATPLQQGLLFHALIDPTHEAGAYINQLKVTIRGPLNRDAFRAAWRAVVSRHAILRTHFEWRHGGEALQIVHRDAELTWNEHGAHVAADDAFLREDLARGVDLGCAPLMRVALFARLDGAHDLVWTSHHVLLDGWSVGRLLGEVLAAYRGADVAAVPPFRQYVAWLRARPSAEAWWRAKLEGTAEAAGLLDGLGASDAACEAGRHAQRLDEVVTSELVAFAQRHRVTLHTMVQAAWAIVLSRLADAENVVFGTTVAGRPAELAGVENMLGLFINTLPVRTTVPAKTCVRAWLHELQSAMGDLGSHEHTPLHELQRWAGRPGAALFDSLIVFENYPVHEAVRASHDLTFENIEVVDRTHYPLTLSITAGASLDVTWTWPKGPLDRATVTGLAEHLERVLSRLVHDGDVCVRELSLDAPRAASTPLPSYAFESVPARVARQAAGRPDAIAVSSAGARLTYAELAAWSERIAQRLSGIAREERIGLCVERGVALPAAMLGVLAAGGAYVPLDPSYPAERLRHMLEDAGIACIVADRASATGLAELFEGRRVVVLDEDAARLPRVAPRVHPAQIAYVLYTSGSTGTPKGVAVSHEALDRFLASTGERPGLGADDVWLSVTSPSFDISALEIYLPLITGARVEIAPREAVADAAVLAELIETSGATVLQATPTAWRALVESGWERGANLVALSGGEALPDDLAAALLARGTTLWNMYGPTETTIWSSAARLAPGERITLGEPLHDTALRVLDARGASVPVGGVGELCIGGTNLARGYLGRPGLTAERFAPDPLGAPGARVYRTGDRCRLRADGTVEFLGRVDQQVKLRGHRIELGEIESALRALPGVSDAVVVVKGEGDHRRLVGYVTGEADPEVRGLPRPTFNADVLRAALSVKLPSIMVPSVLVPLDALPMTLNGKIARSALPDTASHEAFVAPHTATEVTLARVWGEVLAYEPVSASDDFFASGGHSISAVRLVARIRRELARDLPLRTVFERPTLADLAAAIDRIARSTHAPITPRADRTIPIPLSFAQERLWFLWKLEPESAAYTIGGALRLEGDLDVPALRAALGAIVARHESLRTRFETGADGTPVQRVDDEPVYEWTEHEGDANVAAVLARPFDLERGPLFRVALARRGARDHVLVLSMHHIVSDGASIDRFRAELAAEYRAAREGGHAALAPLPIQYGDYALWERETANDASAQLAYWRERLGTDEPALELPADHVRRGARSARGARVAHDLDAPRIRAIDALAQKAGVTRFAVLLAALDVLLHRYAGGSDIRVGVPVSGRHHVETESLIGFFVNTLVLRAEVRPAMPFSALLRDVRAGLSDALANQDVPFARVVDALRPARILGQTPLFRVSFNFEEDDVVVPELRGLARATFNAELRGLARATFNAELDGLRVSPLPVHPDVAFDLMLDVASSPTHLELSFAYATDLFEPATVARLLEDYTAILDTVTADGETRVGAIPLRAPVAPAPVTHAFESVASRFARQVALRPDAIALVFQEQSWTYRELDAWSTRIGRSLVSRGVQREEPVAVCIDRSASVVAAILGIVKAGAAYVPLDPRYPEERLRGTLQDARIRRVVLDASSATELEAVWKGLDVVDVADLPHPADDGGWHLPVQPEQLAYVIYTSGSTGRPKGVGISHASVARLFDATAAQFGFGPADVWSLFHSPSFDVSVFEIFGSLTYGGRLVVVPHATTRDPNAFHRLLAAEKVTVLSQTPSAFVPLMHVDLQAGTKLPELRVIVFAGEKLEPAVLAPWAIACGDHLPVLVNMYGITETTVHVTYRALAPAELDPSRARSVIGDAMDDLELHVFDAGMNAVPVNGVGEIYVGGMGLARGYLGQPGLTASRFVPDPRGGGRRLYASGDRARRLAGGDVEYIGRADSQVKIRGFRIELGEIEAAVRAHPAVRETAVVVRTREVGARIVAYVVAGAEIPRGELRSHLAARLPPHMVPAAIVWLDALPLTPNGKLDRAALPEPAYDELGARTEPRTDMEVRVARIFAAVLGAPAAYAESDFFLLGGDSLAAVRAAARLADEIGQPVEVAALFQHSTVRELARHLDEARTADDGAAALMNDWLDSLT